MNRNVLLNFSLRSLDAALPYKVLYYNMYKYINSQSTGCFRLTGLTALLQLIMKQIDALQNRTAVMRRSERADKVVSEAKRLNRQLLGHYY